MKTLLLSASVVTFTFVEIAYGQVSPANVIPEPAAVGISALGGQVLFSQPYCDQAGVPRGIYTPGSATPFIVLPASSACIENYFSVSSGLGGFPAGDIYVIALLNGSPVILQYAPSGGSAYSVFAPAPVAQSTATHASLTFDTVGTFGFDLIVTGRFGIDIYNSDGNVVASYPNPDSSKYFLEAATVAPVSYSQCPGCLFITAGNIAGGNSGAIYVIPPGAPSGTTPTFFATAPKEPEGIMFVANPSQCTAGGFAYFVSAFSHSPGINPNTSTTGAILEYTAAQLSAFSGQFLVPDEATGVIYAYSGGNAPGTSPNSTVFSDTGYQLEASTTAQCPIETSTTGFMTGGGQLGNFAASHGFELGCNINSNHRNLEVNWAGGNKFKLGSITSVMCYLNSSLGKPNPPAAGFNTMVLTGTGKLNNQPGATVSLIFTDEGEPGTSDHAAIQIRSGGPVVLDVPYSPIAAGNQQAHK